jgi:hypothetical protein
VKLKPNSVIVSVLRAFAMLIVLIGGSAFLQCATGPTPTPTPVPAPADGGTPKPPVKGCDAACANVANLKCKWAEECPSICRLVQNQAYVDCVTRETSCENIDYCNKMHG